MNRAIYKCQGSIIDIGEETFKIVKVKIDNEIWSDSLPLIVRYKDVKDEKLTKI